MVGGAKGSSGPIRACLYHLKRELGNRNTESNTVLRQSLAIKCLILLIFGHILQIEFVDPRGALPGGADSPQVFARLTVRQNRSNLASVMHQEPARTLKSNGTSRSMFSAVRTYVRGSSVSVAVGLSVAAGLVVSGLVVVLGIVLDDVILIPAGQT